MLGAAHDERPPEILVVEDDSGVRRSILMLLKAHGLSAKAYGSGATLAQDPPGAGRTAADRRLADAGHERD